MNSSYVAKKNNLKLYGAAGRKKWFSLAHLIESLALFSGSIVGFSYQTIGCWLSKPTLGAT